MKRFGEKKKLFSWESNNYFIFWACVHVCVCVRARVCMCSLSYPACKANASHYITMCSLTGFAVFSHIYLLKGSISEKKGMEHKMCVLICSTNFSETLLILRRIQLDINTNIHKSLYKYIFFLSDFSKSWIFLKDYRRFFKYEIYQNPSSGSQVFFMRTERRTDGQTYMKKLIVALNNFWKLLKRLLNIRIIRNTFAPCVRKYAEILLLNLLVHIVTTRYYSIWSDSGLRSVLEQY
jgi:hypothetical protein